MAAITASVNAGGLNDHIHPAPEGFVRKYVFSIDHKVIGMQYFITGVFSSCSRGLLAELIRVQLMNPNGALSCRPTYNEVYSIHGRRWFGSC